ncbi:MAG TPA: phosphoribosylamine--glycine ligase N-terminal domain-containing protein [Spirochaetia bacterium]
MRILVLGSGGREHALAWKLSASHSVKQVFVGPGNAGTPDVATNLPGVDPMNGATVVDACRAHRIDCVFVGPEAPLASGIVDDLKTAGIPAIGPDRRAAQLESSKAFSKAFLVRNGVPTAAAAELTDAAAFERHVRAAPAGRLVV